MRTIIILQNPAVVPLLEDFIQTLDQALVVNRTNEAIPLHKKDTTILNRRDLKEHWREDLALTAEDRVILDGTGGNGIEHELEALRAQCAEAPILVLTKTSDAEAGSGLQDTVSYLSLSDVLTGQLSQCWKKFENRKKTLALQQLTAGHEHILILTQHDPDPEDRKSVV